MLLKPVAEYAPYLAWGLVTLAVVGTLLVQPAPTFVREQTRNAETAVRGVNYGNRFIPEYWMAPDFYDGLSQWPGVLKISLADVVDIKGQPARTRMLSWLDKMIQEKHFAHMAEMGVQVVRVPCGYWNWVSYPGDTTPNAPTIVDGNFPLIEKMRNLQKIATPEDYQPYFDSVFRYARKYGIQVLLDLHGVPGSQNGQFHSGIVTGKGPHPPFYFQGSEWNMQMAVKAVGAMAEYGAKQGAALYGIELINEPLLQDKAKPGIGKPGHEFLARYYENALLEARKHVGSEIPLLLYEWTRNFEDWPDNAYQKKHGFVLWDTHIYEAEGTSMTNVTQVYWDAVLKCQNFTARGNPTLVGEWTLGLLPDTFSTAQTRYMAQWLLDSFANFAGGSMFWNYDGPSPLWSFVDLSTEVIDWRAAFAQTTQAYTPEQARKYTV